MMPKKYRRRPLEVDAIQFTGEDDNGKIIVDWINKGGGEADYTPAADPWQSDDGREGHSGYPAMVNIQSVTGTVHAFPGDFVIHGAGGDFYPISNEVFHILHEVDSEEG